MDSNKLSLEFNIVSVVLVVIYTNYNLNGKLIFSLVTSKMSSFTL